MVTHCAYVLAVDGGLLAQLAFVLLALLGWVLNKAAEKKNTEQIEQETAAKRQARADAPPTVAEVLDPFAEAPAPRPTPTPPPLQRAAPKAADRPALVESLNAPAEREPAAKGPAKRHPARERLGIGREVTAREALRRAVLWSAVLGPPRAFAGPHRPPHMQRRSR